MRRIRSASGSGGRMPADTESFDYIVTGAGSAGCAVAARLSESGQYRVLLLEAGGKDRNPWIHIPMGFSRVYANPRVNWMYESEPEAQLGGRRLYQPRGKVLGGTSSINGMVYMRGNAADYDEWRQRGCTGWDWDSVLPYFKKAEHQERGANEFHGSAARCMSLISRTVRNSPIGWWRQQSRRGCLRSRTSMTDARRELDTSRAPPASTAAGAPRRRICGPRAVAAIWWCAPTRMPPAF